MSQCESVRCCVYALLLLLWATSSISVQPKAAAAVAVWSVLPFQYFVACCLGLVVEKQRKQNWSWFGCREALQAKPNSSNGARSRGRPCSGQAVTGGPRLQRVLSVFVTSKRRRFGLFLTVAINCAGRTACLCVCEQC